MCGIRAQYLLVKHNDILMSGVLLCQAQGQIIGLRTVRRTDVKPLEWYSMDTVLWGLFYGGVTYPELTK